MGSFIAVDGVAESSLEQHPGIDALPDSDPQRWNDSPLGPLDKWEPDLRTFSCFITTLPHPAALFWGDELVLVHNEAWKTAADGAAVQGKAQKEVLKEDALSLLRTAMMGRTRQSLQSEMFMNNEAQDGVSYQALLSPVMDNKRNNVARGVLVQLFQMSQKQESRKNQQQSIFRKIQEALSTKGTDNQEKNGKTLLDQLSLDDNPFFQRFAAMLPTGMAILNYKAEAVFVNEQFFELTSTTGQGFKAWPQSIHPDDYDRVMEAYKDAFEGAGKNLRVEFRTLGGEEDKWRLLMLSPLGDGVMRDESIEKYGGFVCAVIDITPNKAQELAQKKAAQEAIERKEQQERFIDMISHEIRNPLSAVLHCAEEIFEIVEPRKEPPSEMSEHDTSALLESAETIKLCVTHQKNIVDDILSFSKLDASMLSLRPKSVQPKRQIGDSLKMFQPEFKKQSMNLNYKIDVSYEKHKVDWVRADLVRISQVLVNLVTNAIKFTARKNGEKNITCMMGASLERPTSYPPNVVFFDSEDSGFRMDGTNSSEWGNGEALYILIAVKDNGIGISDENQKKLFQRFRQATPKTEETYGGSGLGLMIARKLCQLHGGEIGVSSKEGVGSTFGFFFRVRRVVTDQEKLKPEDRIGPSELMKHLHDVTKGKAPIESVSDQDKDDHLKHPKVEKTDEAGAQVKGDEKFHHTANIASHVDGKEDDEYGQASRPPANTTVSSSNLAARPTTLEKMQERTDSSVSKRSTRSATEKNQIHVLLVEDNIIQRILKRKLESKGFRVTPANNGREAVDSVKRTLNKEHDAEIDDSQQFDIILMDQEMPVLDGNAATREIRELEADGEILRVPILGVTANVREPQKDEMKNAGMDNVMSKPYSMEDLIGRIKGLVKHEQEQEGESSKESKKEADAG